TSYAPPGESANSLWEERSNFVGVALHTAHSDLGRQLGIHFTLFIVATILLFKPPKGQKIQWYLLAFISFIFVLGTIYVGANTKAGQLQFIDNRNYPGGPNNYTMSVYGLPVRTLGNAACMTADWLGDTLLIYRCLIIFNFQYWVIFFLSVMLLGSIASGIMVLVETRVPFGNLWTTRSVDSALAFFVINLMLNVVLTSLISLRILLQRRNIQKYMGATHGRQYTSIMAMLIESSALYSTFSLLFIVTYVTSSNIQNLVLPMLAEVQIISPLLIVIRVGLGRGWSKTTATTLIQSDLHFSQELASPVATADPRFSQAFTDTVIIGFNDYTKRTGTIPANSDPKGNKK
ncbi:hypothetical protein K439DRAFT_1567113, partial [Ramaria rubella]